MSFEFLLAGALCALAGLIAGFFIASNEWRDRMT